MLEILILGRGGQGAQTAGNLLAQAFTPTGTTYKRSPPMAAHGAARP